MIRTWLAGLLALLLGLSMATATAAEKPQEAKPELVLVLSGGGARGAAHIGVIRVLEELHIAPDMLVGTSMGAVIGGLYAAGWSPDDMEELVQAIDWENIFTDRVDRRDRSFRRKQDDVPVMIQGRLHFDGLKPVMPSGVIDGQRLELMLRTIEALSPTTGDFDDRLVRKALELEPTQILDRKSLAFDLLELYNSRYFGVIGFEFDEVEQDVHELVVQTPAPVHGRGSLQFGIGFLDDFDGGASYHILARHQYLPANRRGGEWETLFQLGTVAGARTSFYQPLDWGMNWFVEPSLQYQRGTQEIWVDGSAVADYQFRTYDARIAAGRVLGRWGEIRVAAYTNQNRGSPRIGLPGFTSVSEQRAGGELSFRIDTEDSVIFPTSGSGMDLRYTHSSESLGSDGEFNRVFGSASHAWSFGKNTVVPYLEYGDNLDPAESFFSLFPMGGLFRLSGLGDNELLGEKIVLARILAHRRLFQIELAGMGIRIIAGLSLEAGNAYDSDATVSWGNTIKGGSVFVGGETFIGPVIFAYGRTESNRDRFYFAIGDRF